MTPSNSPQSEDPTILTQEEHFNEKKDQARKRLLINLCFCVLDAGGIVPGLGWLAEMASFILSANNIVSKKYSTVPDVPRWVTAVTEAMDIATFGIFASHIVPTIWQITKDWKYLTGQ